MMLPIGQGRRVWAPRLLCAAAAAVAAPGAAGRACAAGNTVTLPPAYVGSAPCRSCHEAQFAAWAPSMHAAAMRDGPAAGRPPAGRATFGKGAASSVEFRRSESGGTEAVIRDGAAAAVTRPVTLTLGRRYLEQPVVAMDGGRLQALPVAWDPAKSEWFDIFSGDERVAGDFGHWTGRGMNANSQCIECHATGYEKRYDIAADRFASVWKEAGVGCEACHGPGSAHVADPKAAYGPFAKGAPLASWRPKPTAVATSSLSPVPTAGPASSEALSAVCASCHAVRRPIAAAFVPGDRLLDRYEPTLFDEETYHADGSVAEEAYEWTSFASSRMHAAGVNCLACHNIHSGELKATGNDLCLGCHEATYAAETHTAHKPGTAASECTSCHMPESTFMARDRRRDHALSIPDPVLARELAAPSACETCHQDLGREKLATEGLRLWPRLGDEVQLRRRSQALAFAAARRGEAQSALVLAQCVAGATCATPLRRASAAKLAVRIPPDRALTAALVAALGDDDALVRSAAAYALADVAPNDDAAQKGLVAATGDDVRAVRVNAAWALRTTDLATLGADAGAVDRSFAEWRESTLATAEAPESWHTMGVFETGRGDAKAAETAYRRAIAMEPQAIPSRYNLAMLLVDVGRVPDARRELEALVAEDDSFAPAYFALGMIQGEAGDWKEASQSLGRCLKLDPGYPGALGQLTRAYLKAGVPNVARAVLASALEHPPARREALVGLVVVALEAGTHEEAVSAARNLVAEFPDAADDPAVAGLAAGRAPAAASPAN